MYKKILMADGLYEVVSITELGHHVLEPVDRRHDKILKRKLPFLKKISEKINSKISKRATVGTGQNIDIYI